MELLQRREDFTIDDIALYQEVMELLQRREDFTNDDTALYQADKFFQAWVLWQKKGIINYIHMIGSVHIADYHYKWKNLYRFSQQGWEAMNSRIETFFFRCTSHGGGVRGDSIKLRLVPIAMGAEMANQSKCSCVLQGWQSEHKPYMLMSLGSTSQISCVWTTSCKWRKWWSWRACGCRIDPLKYSI